MRLDLRGIRNEKAERRKLMKRPAILGVAAILCLVGCGGGMGSSVINQPNPIPAVTSVSPNTVTAGGTAFTLTVNGTNFVAASVVSFGGTVAVTTFINSIQLTAAIPAGAIASAGTAMVTVTNPAPGGGTSNGLNFTIAPVTNNPSPTVTTISPNTANAGGVAFTL